MPELTQQLVAEAERAANDFDRVAVALKALLDNDFRARAEDAVVEIVRDYPVTGAAVNILLPFQQVTVARWPATLDPITPRHATFCQFVLPGEPFVVRNSHELGVVMEADVAAYMGQPIRRENAVVGAVCVWANEPRDWSEEALTRLGEIAAVLGHPAT
jgi:GAF domain-containing protein